jgi:hypothetical protein
MTGPRARAKRLTTSAGAAAKTAVLLLKVYPMLPSRPLDWVTQRAVVERFRYPTSRGPAEGDLYRPSGPGPHPAVVVCLGVVPFGVDHPQVPRLEAAWRFFAGVPHCELRWRLLQMWRAVPNEPRNLAIYRDCLSKLQLTKYGQRISSRSSDDVGTGARGRIV